MKTFFRLIPLLTFTLLISSCGWVSNNSGNESYTVQLVNDSISSEDSRQEINAPQLLKNWEKTRDYWQSTIARFEEQVDRSVSLTPDQTKEALNQLQSVLESSSAVRDLIRDKKAKVVDLLDTISEPESTNKKDEDNSESGETPYVSEELSELRKKYQREVADYDSHLKLIDLIQKQSRQVFSAITASEETGLIKQLNDRVLPPANFNALINDAGKSLSSFWGFISEVTRWLKDQVANASSNAGLYVIGFLLSFAIMAALNYFISRFIGFRSQVEKPNFSRKLIANLAENLTDILFPSLLIWWAFVVIANQLFATDSISPSDSAPAAFIIGLLAFVFIVFVPTYFIKNLLVTDDPKWRIDQFRFTHINSILNRVFQVSLVLGLHVLYSIWQQYLELPNSARYFLTLVFILLEGVLFLRLLSLELWHNEKHDGETQINPITQIARRLSLVIVPIAMISCIGGYLNFSTMLLQNTIVSLAVIILFLGVFRLLIFDSINFIVLQPILRERFGLRIITLQRIKTTANLLVNPALFLLAVYALLRIWGMHHQEVASFVSSLLSDVTIGSVVISPSNIVLGIFTFFAIGYLVKQSRSYIAESIMPDSGLNVGSQYAISSVVTYVGYALAIIIAIVVAGVELGNIALIASALSIGIGFGLQEIVSNFVSGIILIIERPIKVGDWVKIDTQEGIVRKINFRSTEIETFQRSNIIIPNSTVLSSAVVNMTHTDQFGRIDLPIGISYEADIEEFKEIALDVLTSHESTVDNPPPRVFFVEHGDSSLN
ncbi:MAG: mechanosensitive ion channel, partial [Pseudomonadota bacterium]|nr:mechanosensitive ion channel [Pseudomonadota bacterium]